MDRVRSHPGIFVCALSLSFGAVCAMMTLFRMGSSFRFRLLESFFAFALDALQQGSALVLLLIPPVVILLGAAPFGFLLLPLGMSVFGAGVGIGFSGLAWGAGVPAAWVLLLIPITAASVFLSGAVLRLHRLLRRQVLSGALYRPDLRPVVLRIVVYALLFEFSVFLLILTRMI